MKKHSKELLIALGAFVFIGIFASFFMESSVETSRNDISTQNKNVEPPREVVQTNNVFLVTRIIDGDTIEIETGEKVRLICIDAPESSEANYQESKNYLSNLILNKEVKLEKDFSDVDRYNRLLRYIYLDSKFVNEMIIREGYGKAYPYSPDTTKCLQIQEAETLAKNEKIGIWAETSRDSNSDENSCGSDDYNCGDFGSCSEVMEIFESCGYDVNKLDRDGDGIPCESLCA